MDDHQAGPRGRSLRKQARRRLLLVMLITVGGIFVISSLAYLSFRERELAQRQALLESYYQATLPKLEAGWHGNAVQTRVRLEFSRIIEEPEPVRWPKLTAYLNAQWNRTEFSNFVLLDGAGRVLFRYGSEAGALQNTLADGAAWIFVPAYGQLYRVFRLPVWLGQGGEGQLVLFKSVNNEVVRALAIPQTHLILRFGDRDVAESEDAGRRIADRTQPFLHVEIDWPKSVSEQRPTLAAYRDLDDLYAYSDVVIKPVGAVLLIVPMLWFGLGRWLTAIARRIESLGAAARVYAAGGDRGGLGNALEPARSRRDEIGDTALALDRLIDAIERRDQDQRSYLETLALLDEAVIELAPDGRLLRASPGWNRLTHQKDTVGRYLQEFILPDDVDQLRSQCEALKSREAGNAVLRLRLLPHLPSQQEAWIECRLLCRNGAGTEGFTLRGVLRDITQTYLHEKQITHMALHDALTGLPNRVLLEDRMKVALRMASRNQHHVGVCFIDLDHFKMVNDSLGHKAGDRLLIAFSERLRSQLREGDSLARWGGDEFVLLLPDLESDRVVREVADKVSQLIQSPLEVDGSDIRVTFSLGAAIYPNDGSDAETLFSHADRAMFHAKAQGRNQICLFQDMRSKGPGKQELYIQNCLAQAIQDNRIQAWFQPIVDARDGRCLAVEALARWHDERHGWVSPATFIPMAENLGLIHEVGLQVLHASLDALSQWRQRGIRLELAVNVSKRQLFIRTFVEQMLAALTERGLSPGDLLLEVTESVALSDVEQGLARLHELKRAGFKIAIDDFGTGYSSLSQLHEIQADKLKIDMSFVRRLHEPGGLSMVQAIINLARSFGLRTVAEGVENAETADHLRRIGVDTMQGYHFGRPMPAGEFIDWLAANAGDLAQDEKTPETVAAAASAQPHQAGHAS
ncbi:MAG: EAL domain-containing protein [Pseudomonadota bacterium]